VIVVAELTQTCEACPCSWQGTTEDGRAVLIRERHGRYRVEVGGVELRRAPWPESVYMTEAKMREAVGDLLTLPATITPMPELEYA
jgi:hypothetical protein